MARLLKCPVCVVKSEKEEMIYDNKKYYHKSCHIKHLENKAFKEKEGREMDVLITNIVGLHQLQSKSSVPSSFYPFLQELRNDTSLFGRMEKRYKEGVTYITISETYTYCQQAIERSRSTKSFNNLMAEMKYCLTIVRNNIENHLKDKKKSDQGKAQTKVLIDNAEATKNITKAIENAQKKVLSKKPDANKIDITKLFD